jgi:tetratricopeptide (TPR) repeat protein
MSDPINPNSPLYPLYLKAKKDGATDDELDAGYPKTDYVKQTRTTVGRGDGVEERELLDYLLKRDQYQMEVRRAAHYEIPWQLDDMTERRVDWAGDRFKALLAARGWQAGTDDFKERLGLALYVFTESDKEVSDQLEGELKNAGLAGVSDYIVKNGGLGTVKLVDKKCSLESTARQALERGCGECTEKSYILYAVFRRAGLQANIVSVLPNHVISREYATPVDRHESVALHLKRGRRIFDPALRQTDAEPKYEKVGVFWWYELTPAEQVSEYYINLGINYYEQKEYVAALNQYRTALRITPDHSDAHRAQGLAYQGQGQTPQALREYRIAATLDPGNYAAHMNLGYSYWQAGQLAAAEANYSIAASLGPDHADAHANLASIDLEFAGRLGPDKKALVFYLEAVKELKRSYELGQGPIPPEASKAVERIKSLGGAVPAELAPEKWRHLPAKQDVGAAIAAMK